MSFCKTILKRYTPTLRREPTYWHLEWVELNKYRSPRYHHYRWFSNHSYDEIVKMGNHVIIEWQKARSAEIKEKADMIREMVNNSLRGRFSEFMG